MLIIFGSAKIFATYIANNRRLVNIFERTKNDCPGLTWLNPRDSSETTSPVSVEGELYFAGERVPLEDPDVRERLEREIISNTYWHSNTIMSMKLANRYFDELDALLQKNGVPSDFKYLSLIESNFRGDVSPVGAVGFWQLMKGTAEDHDLEVNDEVDERYNIEKSTEAACDYLKDAKEKLGNWTLAAASYNLGLPSMLQRVKDQKTNNYYDMYFNQETSRYIFRMLAMKIIFSNPEKVGFLIKPDELYQPYKYKVMDVDTGISSIADFAAQFGLKYKQIKILNPWLRNAKLTNREHRKYEIRIMEQD